MSVVEVSQSGNKIQIIFENKDEALIHAPAISVLFSDENIRKKRFIVWVFGKSDGQKVKDMLGLEEAFLLAKIRASFVKGFFNV